MSRVFTLRWFDHNDQASFAQAGEIALAQHHVELHTPGTLVPEPRRNGKAFIYWNRYTADGKLEKRYVGSQGGVEEATATHQLHELQLLRETTQKLRKLEFAAVDNSTALTLAVLYNAGVFDRGAVLVGIHAYSALLNGLGARVVPSPLTEDVDIATRLELATVPNRGLFDILKETGLPFVEVPSLKRTEPPTSFKVRGQKLKVGLLVPAQGEPYRAVAVPVLGAYAIGLPYLNYLLHEPIRSIVVGKDRLIPVALPHPGRYCVSKLAVSALRSAGSAKSDKDILQAAVMAAVLSTARDFVLEEAIDEASRTLKQKAQRGATQAVRLLENHYPEAVRLLEHLMH
ncbi:MAG: hypothetical protein FJ147_10155 [Deltaproteobacteria bacterium]|nr:hypothetical protein [Deltaproteobacteria bacterium]